MYIEDKTSRPLLLCYVHIKWEFLIEQGTLPLACCLLTQKNSARGEDSETRNSQCIYTMKNEMRVTVVVLG